MRVFMDESSNIASHCPITLKWAGLIFRADKSRSIVIIKGGSINTTPFSVSSQFTDSQKLWFLQYLLIPWFQWAVLIYEVPISLAVKVEERASVYQKWLKLHQSITSLSFYCSASPCAFPVRSLRSLLKSSKISGHFLLKYSHDPLVSSCVPKLQAGNLQVEEAVQTCKTDLQHKSIIGHQQHQLRISPKVPTDKFSKEFRTFICCYYKEIDYIYCMPFQRQCNEKPRAIGLGCSIIFNNFFPGSHYWQCH